MQKIELIILDRDGVINQDSDQYVKSPEEWIPLPGSIEAIARLTQAGLPVVVATNQSGLARGYFDATTLDAMHAKMRNLVETAGGKLDGIFVCPHGPDDDCECRKPKPGLLKKIGAMFDIPATNTIVIGDAMRDIDAGKVYGAKVILVLTGKGKRTLAGGGDLSDVSVYKDLAEAVEEIVKNHKL